MLYNAVCEHGLEGIVANKRNSLYRPGYRGWAKVKNPGYWGASQRWSTCKAG
jgi:ATP-dependent DNA ligase